MCRWPAPILPPPDACSPRWRRRRSTCCVSPALTSRAAAFGVSPTCAISVSAPMPGSGGALELPRHPSVSALKGTRPVFFPDAGKMLPTQVWDRYALEPGVHIDGPAVFEEDESTFIVGPGAKARLLGDGSILAEVG